MPVSLKRFTIKWGYFIISTIVFVSLYSATKQDFFGYLFLANIILTFWIVRIGVQLQKTLIPTVTCRNCGMVVDLVALWKCGCGYTKDRPRHAFDRCRKCRQSIGYITCPKCDVSINL